MFISSKLDYCNALLYGLPDREINRLQSIQNGTVRLVSGDKRFEVYCPCGSIRALTGSQCRIFSTGTIYSNLLSPDTKRTVPYLDTL